MFSCKRPPPHQDTSPQWPGELWPLGCQLPFVILFPKRRTHKEWWVVFVYLSGRVYSPFSLIVTLHVSLFSLLRGMSLLIKSISWVALALLLSDRKYTFLSSPCRFLFEECTYVSRFSSKFQITWGDTLQLLTGKLYPIIYVSVDVFALQFCWREMFAGKNLKGKYVDILINQVIIRMCVMAVFKLLCLCTVLQGCPLKLAC